MCGGGWGGLLPSLCLHVHLRRGGHKFHPRPFPPRGPTSRRRGAAHAASTGLRWRGRGPGGTRLSIGLSHDGSLGRWGAIMGNVGGRDITSAARGKILLGRKMDATRGAGHSFAHRAVNGRTNRAQAMPQGSLIIPNPNSCHRCPFPQGPGLHWGTHPPACDLEHTFSIFPNPAAYVASVAPTQYSGAWPTGRQL